MWCSMFMFGGVVAIRVWDNSKKTYIQYTSNNHEINDDPVPILSKQKCWWTYLSCISYPTLHHQQKSIYERSTFLYVSCNYVCVYHFFISFQECVCFWFPGELQISPPDLHLFRWSGLQFAFDLAIPILWMRLSLARNSFSRESRGPCPKIRGTRYGTWRIIPGRT